MFKRSLFFYVHLCSVCQSVKYLYKFGINQHQKRVNLRYSEIKYEPELISYERVAKRKQTIASYKQIKMQNIESLIFYECLHILITRK